MPGNDPKSLSPHGKPGSGEKDSGSGGHESGSEGGPTLKKASTSHSAMETAMLLYPLLESRWLALVKGLHTYGYTAVQLSLKPGLDFAAVKQEITLLKSQLNDIEQKVYLLKGKIKALASEVAADTELIPAGPMFAAPILSARLVILNLELVASGQILGRYLLKKASISDELAKKLAAAAEMAAKSLASP